MAATLAAPAAPTSDTLAPHRRMAARLVADGFLDPGLLGGSDVDGAARRLRAGRPEAEVTGWLADVASGNAIALAMFYGIPVRRRGTAEEGGEVWVYDRGRVAGRAWRPQDDEDYPYARWEAGLPFEEDGVEVADPEFDPATLPYCEACETRFGCRHHHAPRIRIAPGYGPVVVRA